MPVSGPMIVTTSYEPQEEIIHRSKGIAKQLQCPWVQRNKLSLSKLKEKYKVQQVWIVTRMDMIYYHEQQPPLFFHPSTALLRIKRLLKGEKDTLIECSGASRGDCILDCTAGMGSDAIVFSYWTGKEGKVIALESQIEPYLIVREGLKRYQSEVEELNEAMNRIEIIHNEHLDYLMGLPDQSVDIIYFDPMFRIALADSSALAPIRSIANHQPLDLEAITHAKRVARKSVVLKEHVKSKEFVRLGFEQVYSTYSKIAYGVINP